MNQHQKASAAYLSWRFEKEVQSDESIIKPGAEFIFLILYLHDISIALANFDIQWS